MKEHIEQLKSHIGKEVFLVGTGNNARRTDSTRKDVIESVGRVKVVLHTHGVLRVSEEENLHLEDHCNGGHYVFFNESDLRDHYEKKEISGKLSGALNYRSDWDKLSIHQLRKISQIVFKGGE